MKRIICNMAGAICTIILIVISGCTHTSIQSRINPEFRGTQYRRILVIAAVSDLKLQADCEGKVCSKLYDQGVYCLKASDVLFPKMKEEYYAGILDSNQIDGILIIFPADAGVSDYYLPPSQKTKTEGTFTDNGFGSTNYRGTSKTTTSGGYVYSKPWANFEAEFYDVQEGSLIWFSTLQSSGNAYASFDDIVRSVGGKVVNKLRQDGILK